MKKTGDRFSATDLERLHRKWKKILIMEHFNGEVLLVDKIDDDGTVGLCVYKYGINWYTIKILDPYYIIDPKNYGADVEATLVHELAHCKRFWELRETDPVKIDLFERDVEETSRIMVRLHRGQ